MGLFFDEEQQEKYNKLSRKFHEILIGPDGEKGRQYFKSRNVSDDLLEKFMLGYCPENVKLSEKFSYLSGRIVCPIIDELGNTIAFSGRKIDSKDWFHDTFQKSFFLYGLNVAWKNILKTNSIIIVEGQFDVLSMWKHGFTNTVGVLGGVLAEEGIIKLARFTNRFITIFDGDLAGICAASRVMDFLKDYESSGYEHLNVCLRIDQKEYDPDEFLEKYGTSGMISFIKKASDNKREKRKSKKIEDLINVD